MDIVLNPVRRKATAILPNGVQVKRAVAAMKIKRNRKGRLAEGVHQSTVYFHQ